MRQFVHFAVILTLLMLFQSGLVFGASNLDEGVNELATQISKNMLTTEKNKIAVVEFTNLDGTVSAFGKFLAEELITRLFMVSPGKFTVVERSQLQKVFKELGFQMIEVVDETTIKKLGKILGVDAIVTGSITDLGNTVKVNGRMISTETARVFAVAATEIPKVGTVVNLMGKQVVKVRPTLSKPQPIKPEEVEKERFFQTGDLRIIPTSFKKAGDRIVLALTYENPGDKNIEARFFYPHCYLLDENGERWKCVGVDPASVGGYNFAEEIVAKTKLTPRLEFIPEGRPTGTRFTAVIPHSKPIKTKAVIYNLVPE